MPPKGSSWRRPPDEIERLESEKRIYWGKNGDAEFPVEKKFLNEVKDGVVPQSWWPYDFAGSTRNASAELKALFGSKAFDTPKPEKLIERVLQAATVADDLVLDSFLGSGTTAAVAQKMNRRYIGVEEGDHAVELCAPRLRKVIDGEQGGISKSVGWQGGGGFAFYRLGEPVFDDAGRINPAIRFPHLAAHVWFSETGTPLASEATGPWLGVSEGRGLALLYNGILGDKSVSGGNVLTVALLKRLRADGGGWAGPITINGEASRIGPERLKGEGVTFKQTPYDVRAR